VRSTTKDIGLGGLCLRTQRSYEPGTSLQLVIELEGGQSLDIEAVVAWVRTGEAIGVRFETMSDEQQTALTRILREGRERAKGS